jgi:hypothetical protein
VLAFADALHQRDTADCDRRIFVALQAQHHREMLLHASMILLSDVVTRWDRAEPSRVDRLRRGFLAFDRLGQEAIATATPRLVIGRKSVDSPA